MVDRDFVLFFVFLHVSTDNNSCIPITCLFSLAFPFDYPSSIPASLFVTPFLPHSHYILNFFFFFFSLFFHIKCFTFLVLAHIPIFCHFLLAFLSCAYFPTHCLSHLILIIYYLLFLLVLCFLLSHMLLSSLRCASLLSRRRASDLV